MYKQGMDLRVQVNGRPVREYSQNGSCFVESRNGTNYTLKVKNDNGFRVMAIVSVDGLDVITGKPAEETNTGYIVDAYSSTEIKGYRISDMDSAAFVFSSKGESYVANVEVGDVRNAGVIGVRIIREREQPQMLNETLWSEIPKPTIPSPVFPYPRPNPWRPYYQPHWVDGGYITSTLRSSDTPPISLYNCSVKGNAFDMSQATCDSFDTGTTWGDQQHDKVRRITFDRGEQVAELVLYYSSAKALEKINIDMADTPIVADGADDLPKPFGKSSGYCTPPKNWKRNV